MNRGSVFRKRTIVNTEPLLEMTNDAVNTLKTENFVLNPGNGALFPWLANQAICYKKYKFNSLSLIFKSTVATSFSG